MGPYLDAWQSRYSASSSNEAGCQLCHMNRDGGDGWNVYGWQLRNDIILSGRSLDTAFRNAEGLDLDIDPVKALTITEIELGAQPGWVSTSTNVVSFKDGSKIFGLLPPDNFADAVRIDPPLPVTGPVGSPILRGNVTLKLDTISSGFQAPIYATQAPNVDQFMFVVEQTGRIWAVDLNSGLKELFLDVSDYLVDLELRDERGLLGLAFHPNYSQNGLFYTYQSEPASISDPDFSTMPPSVDADHQSVVSQWRNPNPRNVELVPNDRLVILRIDQPQSNNNGGMIAFGPDNYLYISLGDGGNEEDEEVGHSGTGNGRNFENPLGAILRIDVQGENSANGLYGIPDDNPFVDQDGLDEIYSYGFRNVFRFSFDSNTGELYAGDTGQYDFEEINIVNSGGNYGWNWMEGRFSFYQNGPIQGYISEEEHSDLPDNLIFPLAEYHRNEGEGIIGGYVYRGKAYPEFDGFYIFADVNNRLFILDSDRREISELRASMSRPGFITSFAQDNQGELYLLETEQRITSDNNGTLRKVKLEPADYFCLPIQSKKGGSVIICL